MLVLSKCILLQIHTAILQTKIRDERWKRANLRTVLHSGACTDPGLMSWLSLDKRTKPCDYPSVSYDSKMSQGLWRKPNHWVLYFFQLYRLWAVRKKHTVQWWFKVRRLSAVLAIKLDVVWELLTEAGTVAGPLSYPVFELFGQTRRRADGLS